MKKILFNHNTKEVWYQENNALFNINNIFQSFINEEINESLTSLREYYKHSWTKIDLNETNYSKAFNKSLKIINHNHFIHKHSLAKNKIKISINGVNTELTGSIKHGQNMFYLEINGFISRKILDFIFKSKSNYQQIEELTF